MELWLDRARSALGIQADQSDDPNAFRITSVTGRISLARMAKAFGFTHVFDDRVVPYSSKEGMYVFELNHK